ncbi:MAG: BrnA antitoxin family protein [Gammaproteobacteria bacterium]|nr:BrnA antitoxin family protein [Gammaproteobacteria bacterium]
MKENKKHSISNWVDPDDAPEITPELMSSGVKMIADNRVSDKEFSNAVKKRKVGRPAQEKTKMLVSIRYDAEIIEYFKSTGKGWQSRINEVLAKYIASH